MTTERALKRASLLIASGAVVQLACLLKVHPLSFVASALLGVPFIAAGAGYYLLAVVSRAGDQSPEGWK